MIPTKPTTVLAAQIIAHLALIPMIMYGHWYHWLAAVFVYFLNGCLGVTMTYHRLNSHKCWKCPRFLEAFFLMCATIGMTGPAISWAAVHRKHHAFTDTEKDPYSPKHKGIFWCHYLSMFAKVELKYASHLLRDKLYGFQHKHYFTINLAYAAALWFAFGPFALVYAWLVPAAMLWTFGSTIVSISHRGGKIHSDPILWFLTWGEGYHDKHHEEPNTKRFGKWDLGGFLIERIEAVWGSK